MATITFRTESTGLRPRSDHATVRGRRSLFSDEAMLSPRSRTVNARDLRRFVCNWPETNAGQRALLLTAWRDSLRGALPMNYTPVGKTDVDALEVQFVKPPTERRVGPSTYELGCELIEVR